MHIGRAIIIPAILALSLAGPILAGAKTSVAAGRSPSVHTQVIEISGGPYIRYHT